MKRFTNRILKWYEKDHRKLPWRETRDPYLIWLSEVILQQTRVDQGMDYYLRFAKEYPEVEVLASADEADVLKNWQGLGYYSRARNLLFAARQVMNEFNGRFPDNFESLKLLKGVGEYTAAAIASIAFDEVVPVVDGNVKRVISRVAGIKGSGDTLYKEVHKVMTGLIDCDYPGDFNQAVMEFGALKCTPLKPACNECIFKSDCYAYRNDAINKYPEKTIKRKPEARYLSYLIIHVEGPKKGVIFNKRLDNDIWKNLYDFPLISDNSKPPGKFSSEDPGLTKWFIPDVRIGKQNKTYKHQLTHRTIMARFYAVYVKTIKDVVMQKGWGLIPHERIDELPIPRLIDRYIKDHPADF